MDAIALLDWLLECDVDALLRVDAGRGGVRPWTFAASTGEWSLRVDAFSADECMEKTLKALADHGLVPPESLT